MEVQQGQCNPEYGGAIARKWARQISAYAYQRDFASRSHKSSTVCYSSLPMSYQSVPSSQSLDCPYESLLVPTNCLSSSRSVSCQTVPPTSAAAGAQVTPAFFTFFYVSQT
eukprot:CAMPEP_0206135746 /NCGR_PEP_ID=MMETSP1473-20131121/1020_1 /ASSEMBLY_ACC=CAM_ASM_001109 /TAXON_ID=1461547 /ORGANISM="Stichococcus sp, Strain RCC1054" /LENGTH=110 /DNA_ID=CAMNT_0053527819 /DNA_START=206 /DNA_END=534 /DNA_ORIENTATION=+